MPPARVGPYDGGVPGARREHDLLQRVLVPVIATVFVCGALAVATHDEAASGATAGRASTAGDGSGPTESAGQAPPDDPAETAPVVPTSTPTDPAVPTELRGPVPGTYRYQVTTTSGADSTVRTEEREISLLEDTADGVLLRVVARSDEEAQVSVLDWSPRGSFVRSTQVVTDGTPAEECVWDPPLTDLGPLESGSSWTVDSSCTTSVTGLATDFQVLGSGRVVRETEVTVGGARVRAWEIQRDRTTVISTTVAERTLEQRAREVGTIYVDAVRGIIVRSDVVVTLSGQQSGENRRVVVLED